MVKSGYILAGFESLASILNNYMLGKNGRFYDNFTRDQISDFLGAICSGFLHSYGQNFAGKKRYKNYNKNEENVYNKCRSWGFFNSSNLIVDSGGFQISVGRLTRAESDLLGKMYYEWIENHHHVIERAFILDIPPGPNCEIFETFKDVYDLNLESYNRAKELPDDIRKKIIYIHHFRTPQLWKLYTKILREDNMFSAFQHHGTGGIVANMSSDMVIPCIIYVLPIIPLLNEAKRCGRDFLNFHILGGANFRDVTFYELFRKVVLEKHNIKLNITYDSSGLFKSLMIGRYLWVDHPDGHVQKMDLRSPNLNNMFSKYVRVYEQMQIVLDKFASDMNFKKIKVGEVYDPKTGTFYEDVKVYSMLYMLWQWAEIQERSRKIADEIYPLYKSGEVEEFAKRCATLTRNLNSGKMTKKGVKKASSVEKSLDMLAQLDEDYCEDLVKKFLAKDEFINLDHETELLSI
jgi:hypothetical protein